MAFATFLVWRLRTGACGVGACGFWRYRMPPGKSRLCSTWLVGVERQAELHVEVATTWTLCGSYNASSSGPRGVSLSRRATPTPVFCGCLLAFDLSETSRTRYIGGNFYGMLSPFGRGWKKGCLPPAGGVRSALVSQSNWVSSERHEWSRGSHFSATDVFKSPAYVRKKKSQGLLGIIVCDVYHFRTALSKHSRHILLWIRLILRIKQDLIFFL